MHRSALEMPGVPKAVVAVVSTSVVVPARLRNSRRKRKLLRTSSSSSSHHRPFPHRDLPVPSGKSRCHRRMLTVALRLPLPSR